MALTAAEKKEVITKFGASASDTGSPEAQVALLSKRIDQLTQLRDRRTSILQQILLRRILH